MWMEQEVGDRTVIKMRAEEKAHVRNKFGKKCFKGLAGCEERMRVTVCSSG